MYFVEMMNHLIRRGGYEDGKDFHDCRDGREGIQWRWRTGEEMPGLTVRIVSSLDRRGNLYVCDIGNHRIRKIDMKTGMISTFSGTGKKAKTKDGGKISEVDLMGRGRLMWSEIPCGWLCVREMQCTGWSWIREPFIMWREPERRDLRGMEVPPKATLSGPKGIAVGPKGNIYLADTESHTPCE